MISGYLLETYMLFLEMAPYLLLGLAFVALLNLFITKEIVKKQIGDKSIWSVFKAALFGVPLPLCSCGVIPTTVYMADSEASKGAVTSFLISTPQTGIDSIIATYGMMGIVFAVFRPIAALAMGISGGLFIDSMVGNQKSKLAKDSNNKSFKLNVINKPETEEIEKSKKSLYERFKKSLRYAFVDFMDDISGEFLLGILIAGVIAYFFPADIIEGTGFETGILGMLLMILIGAPMYICATASIPIAVALLAKGFSPGVVFVFLAVGPATNAASLSVLIKSLGKKTIILYLISLSILSIISGYVLDFIFQFYSLDPMEYISMHNGEHSGLIPYEIQIPLAVIFSVIMLTSLYRKYIRKYFSSDKSDSRNSIDIKGMTCNHCTDTVYKSLIKVAGIRSLEVDLERGKAYYEGNPDKETLEEAVTSCGYTVK